jgi:hypothetical protein
LELPWIWELGAFHLPSPHASRFIFFLTIPRPSCRNQQNATNQSHMKNDSPLLHWTIAVALLVGKASAQPTGPGFALSYGGGQYVSVSTSDNAPLIKDYAINW